MPEQTPDTLHLTDDVGVEEKVVMFLDGRDDDDMISINYTLSVGELKTLMLAYSYLVDNMEDPEDVGDGAEEYRYLEEKGLLQ